MKASIKHYKPADEFFTAEKCYITELSNSDDDPDLSIARARVEPGVTTHWHRLSGTIERYCIISGRGRMELGDYGYCVICDEEIAEGRLRFDPSILTCIFCAKEADRR